MVDGENFEISTRGLRDRCSASELPVRNLVERGKGLKPLSLGWKPRAQSIYQPRIKVVENIGIKPIKLKSCKDFLGTQPIPRLFLVRRKGFEPSLS